MLPSGEKMRICLVKDIFSYYLYYCLLAVNEELDSLRQSLKEKDENFELIKINTQKKISGMSFLSYYYVLYATIIAKKEELVSIKQVSDDRLQEIEHLKKQIDDSQKIFGMQTRAYECMTSCYYYYCFDLF